MFAGFCEKCWTMLNKNKENNKDVNIQKKLTLITVRKTKIKCPYLQLFAEGHMSYLRYLFLFAHSGVQYTLCLFLLCFSSSYVPYVASFSYLCFFFNCPFGIIWRLFRCRPGNTFIVLVIQLNTVIPFPVLNI